MDEETKKRIRYMFENAVRHEEDTFQPREVRQWWSGRRMTIIDMLNELNIKVEGVNA